MVTAVAIATVLVLVAPVLIALVLAALVGAALVCCLSALVVIVRLGHGDRAAQQ